ncbi:MAG TPA: heme ABC exporter ATP-binding protein CcmA [Xanthobacteraceae bacterium]|nr:heme ABC exporter ATP-binding protein CcmA [Xanthobacteraceae bacterium]
MRISASNLGCVRGSREIFRNVNFSISSGQALAVLGPNGAGKSSLLRIMAGLLRLDAGRLELDGGDPDLTIPEQAHYLGHQDALKPSLSVAENLAFWARYLGDGFAGLTAALEAVGLAPIRDLPAGYLSAGQRRRLSIARLVAVRRPIWLLDEAAAALDQAAQARLIELMRGHLAGGGLILAATHAPLGLDAVQELRLEVAR